MRESLCEMGVSRVAVCEHIVIGHTLYGFECQKLVEWAQISFMLGSGWSSPPKSNGAL